MKKTQAKKTPFNMLSKVNGYCSPETENFEMKEYEQKISQSSHTVFHNK